MKAIRHLAVLAAAILMAGCESMKVNSDFDPAADFTTYGAFAWVSDHPLMAAAPGVSPLAEGRIQTAVTRELTTKGYRFQDDPATADFLVGFTLGAREKIVVDATAYPAGFYRPYRWGTPYYQDIDVRQYQEGQLAIDIFDVKQKRPVWHGFATKTISSQDEANPQKTIDAAVAAILAKFPPGP